MKIKKPASQGPATAPAGGAAIAARFQLDPVATTASSAKNGVVGKKSALTALIAGCICLALASILTFMLYKHWEYLMPA